MPASCPTQPAKVDDVLPPIDPPVFRRAFSRPARIALILLEERWRAGGERGERARHHLAQLSHVPRIKAGSSFLRRAVQTSLLPYGSAIHPVCAPVHIPSRHLFIGQYCPGLSPTSPTSLQGCVVV